VRTDVLNIFLYNLLLSRRGLRVVIPDDSFERLPEKNTIQYTVPYYPRTNPIEQYFSQMKHYLKKESPVSFADIKKVVEKSIAKVKEQNYNNYFLHVFRSETLLKTIKTRRRTPKVYKIDPPATIFFG